MKRRKFITLLGGAAAVWPMAARAQPAEGVRRIGVWTNLAADGPESQSRNAFLQGLQELGWSVGRNVRLDYRFTLGDAERTRRYAVELVALAPDVVLSVGAAATAAMQQATRTVPTVFVLLPDPVGAGRRQSGPAGRQCDRVYAERIRPEREVVALRLCACCAAEFAGPPSCASRAGLG